MKTIKKANILSTEEQSLLRGGRRIYKIGDKVVSKEEYKQTVQDATGSASEH
ncbi:MAG: hypothetical protein GQ574_10540 [Crocinitomix sp.]|nr:hypothetical protein [Crocinitomix sp.]